MSLAKYSSSKRQYQQSPIQDRLEDVDIDPYAPTIVEDLLQVCYNSLAIQILNILQ